VKDGKRRNAVFIRSAGRAFLPTGRHATDAGDRRGLTPAFLPAA